MESFSHMARDQLQILGVLGTGSWSPRAMEIPKQPPITKGES